MEKHLLKLMDCTDMEGNGALVGGKTECNVQLDIGETLSWIIKFRKFGVIINNRCRLRSSYFFYKLPISH